jgi:hypothetical protein
MQEATPPCLRLSFCFSTHRILTRKGIVNIIIIIRVYTLMNLPVCRSYCSIIEIFRLMIHIKDTNILLQSYMCIYTVRFYLILLMNGRINNEVPP